YFYFQPEQHVAFLGGSIERLYSKENRMLKSEAIAGTRRRGRTTQEDKALAKDLLHCDKDLREHNFVVENIKENLEKLCHTVDIDDEITLLKLAQVQHLRCRLQGILADDISDAQILQTMHPTPAVGGSPTNKAIAAIKKLEPFDRGWYAAPIGWVSNEASEFVVGIRSGLVEGNKLALFSGAGIVKGSTPDGEWAEIENKIANFMKAIMA
ncbi:MAG: isochorismate synthase MenF, partial [bacterium]